jgi:heat-inducible transcriptional repressor
MYFEGTAKLLTSERLGDVSELNLLMETLERRVALLGALRSVLSVGREALPTGQQMVSADRRVAVRIGAENELPALRSTALIAAGYGLPQRPLGTVSVIGPLRMDYGGAIRAVREAAAQLSVFVAEVYDER